MRIVDQLETFFQPGDKVIVRPGAIGHQVDREAVVLWQEEIWREVEDGRLERAYHVAFSDTWGRL
jgi:hypothetical protein